MSDEIDMLRARIEELEAEVEAAHADPLDYINPPPRETRTYRLVPVDLPDGIHPCPTCDRAGCERCAATGRGAYARVYADSTGDGRATLQLWFGAAATMELVARNYDSLSHDRVDSILATLAEAPGVVIRDRRGR